MNQELRWEIETKLDDLADIFRPSDIKLKLSDLAEFIAGALGHDESQFVLM